MIEPFAIEPASFYDDVALRRGLGLRYAALKRARKDGQLRYTRRGGRLLYLGRWVLDWLTADGDQASRPRGRNRDEAIVGAEAQAVAQ